MVGSTFNITLTQAVDGRVEANHKIINTLTQKVEGRVEENLEVMDQFFDKSVKSRSAGHY